MKFTLLFPLLFLLVISTSSLSENSLINSNKLFNFAEQSFPEYFSPAEMTTMGLDNYLVRYYPDTDIYLGTRGGEVYVYGDVFNGLLKVGVFTDYIQLEPDGDDLLAQLFADGHSDVQVYGTGTVVSILSDDINGSRHQRFIIELKSEQTLLIAHNINLAPRIDELAINDQIEFFGEYEWNDQGGIVHWTHHDPEKIHIDGWILHNHNIYQ
jgi:Protein of unknown function (DUF3465)